MFEDIDIKFRKTNVVEISWLPCVWIHCLILRVQQCRDESKIYNYQQMVFASDLHWHWLFRLFKRLYRPPTHILSISWLCMCSLRKQPRFGDATTGFPAKWRLRNERRNSILMTRYFPIWVVLLIGWNKFPTRHDQSEADRKSVV